MKYFDGMFDNYIGCLRCEGTVSDFVSFFYVQMLRRKITGCTVAVRNHKSMLIW